MRPVFFAFAVVLLLSASPDFTLKVQAANVSGGTAASQVTLSTTAAHFVTAISKTVGTCDLSYTASATAGQGTGSDVQTVHIHPNGSQLGLRS